MGKLRDGTTIGGYTAVHLGNLEEHADEVLETIKQVDGADSGLDADTVDGKHSTAFANSSHTHTGVDITSSVAASNSCSGNSATATKLKTGRTITLDGDASGQATFDGSANISLTTNVHDNSHNHVISNVDGLQTALNGKSGISHIHTGDDITSTVASSTTATKLANARNIVLSGDASGSVSFDGTSDATILTTIKDDSHNHIISNVDGLQTELNSKLGASSNAVSASKLNTARTITLFGDASGSLSFDGSENKTVAVVVADNSHNHTISNVSNLQTTLDNFEPKNSNIQTHIASKVNPHAVTTTQIGASPIGHTHPQDPVFPDGVDITGYLKPLSFSVGKNDYSRGDISVDTDEATMLLRTWGVSNSNIGVSLLLNGSNKEVYIRRDGLTGMYGGNKIWHAGNDGHESGLDADTLDGLHASDLKPLQSMYAFKSSENEYLIKPDEIAKASGIFCKIYLAGMNITPSSTARIRFDYRVNHSATDYEHHFQMKRDDGTVVFSKLNANNTSYVTACVPGLKLDGVSYFYIETSKAGLFGTGYIRNVAIDADVTETVFKSPIGGISIE